MAYREFKRTLWQSVLSFQFDVLSLVPGLIFAASVVELGNLPALVVLYPVFLSSRGALGGILSGKLSTALNVGWVRPSLRGNTSYYWALLASQMPLALLASTLYAGIATASGGDPAVFAALSLSLSLTLNLLFLPLFSTVAFYSFKAGLDPDITLYPLMSSVADFAVTVFFVQFARLVLAGDHTPIYALAPMLPALATYTLIRYREEEVYRKVVVQGSLSILATALIVATTGAGVSSLVEKGAVEVAAAFPALADLLGDAGSAFGSLLTTRLMLGGLETLKKEKAELAGSLAAVAITYVAMATAFSAAAALVMGGDPLASAVTALKASLFSLPTGLAVSAVTAVSTFKLRLDPDVFVIPLHTCLSDMITAYSLLAATFM